MRRAPGRRAPVCSTSRLKYRLSPANGHANAREGRDILRWVRLQHNKIRIHPRRQTTFVRRESKSLRGRHRKCSQYLAPIEHAAKLAIFFRRIEDVDIADIGAE